MVSKSFFSLLWRFESKVVDLCLDVKNEIKVVLKE